MNRENLNMPREEYEPVVSRPVDLEFMGTEITLCIFDIHENYELKTCYGDICKIVNALRDYSQMLKMVCDTWDLHGFHRATYEFHAEKLREVADKFQVGIGYDYDAAVERCEKRKGKKRRDEDVGGEAMAMGFLKSQQVAEAKAKKASEKDSAAEPSAMDSAVKDSPWAEDE